MIAERWGLSRAQLDEFSLGSHEKAAAAIDEGRFAAQIAPVDARGRHRRRHRRGRPPRRHARELAKLKPAFKPDGVIHAGNSSQISDGAAALLMTTSEKAAGTGPDPDRPRAHRRAGRR